MKYIIIGTAGHVDHGKTALIKALTGTDTDRLKEEKQRGISIDLGFASLALAGGILAGIVDVPGHERFLKNMLAGTGGIDLAMLVIAADEGVMPQTREHLAMLQLYGISHGIVVINKIDKVDPEWLELVTEEVQQLLAGTFLAEAPCCYVSAVTGQGLPELRTELAACAAALTARDSSAPFRLWLDRVFTVKGHGVVVTGSVLSGTAKLGDTLMLYPAGITVRVRGLECHGNKAETVYAGQRAAINLAGVDLSMVSRGMCLSAPERGEISNVWDVKLIWQQPVENGTRIRLHLGTGEYIGRLYYFKDASQDYGRLVLESPLGGAGGDRGILRLYSPQQLVGGVMLVAPGRNKRLIGEQRLRRAEAIAEHKLDQLILAVLNAERQPLTLGEIMRSCGYIADNELQGVISKLTAEGRITQLGGVYWAQNRLAELTKDLQTQLAQYHTAQPERQGMPKEVLRQNLAVDDKHFEHLLAFWQQQGYISVDGAQVALAAHAARHNDWWEQISTQAAEVLAVSGFNSLDAAILAEKLQIPLAKARQAFELLQRDEKIIRIGDMNISHYAIEKTISLLQEYFRTHATITVGELRDLLQTSRKVALPLLEYFDLHKYTVRVGDKRRAGARLYKFSDDVYFL